MLIKDLPYLENVAEYEPVYGAAMIGAYASAGGDDTFTLTDTDLAVKNKKNGKSKLTGEATALAIGEDPLAITAYDLDCFGKVKAKTVNREGEYFAYEYLRVKAKC